MLAPESEIYRIAEQTRVIQLRQLMRPRQTKRATTTSLSLTPRLRGLALEVNALLTLLYPVMHHYSTQRHPLHATSPEIADECQFEHVG